MQWNRARGCAFGPSVKMLFKMAAFHTTVFGFNSSSGLKFPVSAKYEKHHDVTNNQVSATHIGGQIMFMVSGSGSSYNPDLVITENWAVNQKLGTLCPSQSATQINILLIIMINI